MFWSNQLEHRLIWNSIIKQNKTSLVIRLCWVSFYIWIELTCSADNLQFRCFDPFLGKYHKVLGTVFIYKFTDLYTIIKKGQVPDYLIAHDIEQIKAKLPSENLLRKAFTLDDELIYCVLKIHLAYFYLEIPEHALMITK